MATSGRRLDTHTRQSVEKRIRDGLSVYRIARDLQLSETTVRKIRQVMLTSVGNTGA